MDLLKSINKTVRFYSKFEYNRIIKKYTPKELGAWSKNEISRMGPSFIKIGQFVSTRSDVFSKELTDELKDLQDNVDPVPWEIIRQDIPVEQFDEILIIPLASASIGQVHLAKLNNIDVVIKIKRPNIEEDIKVDFQGLLTFIKFMKSFSNDRRLIEFEILFTEYYNLLQEEINFIKEANNMEKFKTMFENTPWIKIPKLYKEYSNNTYITMEYVPGIKINDIEKLSELYNLEKISNKLLECYVDQIIKYGLIQIDPHPGNVSLTPDGKIVFYDYGMILDLDPKIQEHFDQLLMAIYDKDIDCISDLAIEMGLIVVDKKNIPYFKKFLIFFISYIEKLDINDFKISYIDDLNKSDMPFLISSKFLLLLRGLSILEGNCKLLDKNFNYKKSLDPYIQKYLIDFKYIENKAILDLSMIKTYPTTIKRQEIEIDILKQNFKQGILEKDTMYKNKLSILGSLLLVISIIHQDLVAPMYAAIIITVLLH